MEREMNMWRFVLGVGVGVILTVVVLFALPFKWEDDPEKKTVGKAHDKLIVIIGTDVSMDYISQCRSNEFDGNQRTIHIFQNPADAEACKKRVLEQATKSK